MNQLANIELLQDLNVKAHLTVGNEVSTPDLVISRKLPYYLMRLLKAAACRRSQMPITMHISTYARNLLELTSRLLIIPFNMRIMLQQ